MRPYDHRQVGMPMWRATSPQSVQSSPPRVVPVGRPGHVSPAVAAVPPRVHCAPPRVLSPAGSPPPLSVPVEGLSLSALRESAKATQWWQNRAGQGSPPPSVRSADRAAGSVPGEAGAAPPGPGPPWLRLRQFPPSVALQQGDGRSLPGTRDSTPCRQHRRRGTAPALPHDDELRRSISRTPPEAERWPRQPTLSAAVLEERDREIQDLEQQLKDREERIAALTDAHCRKVIILEDDIAALRSEAQSAARDDSGARRELEDKDVELRRVRQELSDALAATRELQRRFDDCEARCVVARVEAEEANRLRVAAEERLATAVADSSAPLRAPASTQPLPEDIERRAVMLYASASLNAAGDSPLPPARDAAGRPSSPSPPVAPPPRAELLQRLCPPTLVPIADVVCSDLRCECVSLVDWLEWLARVEAGRGGDAATILDWLEAGRCAAARAETGRAQTDDALSHAPIEVASLPPPPTPTPLPVLSAAASTAGPTLMPSAAADVREVTQWFAALGLSDDYSAALREHAVDGAAVHALIGARSEAGIGALLQGLQVVKVGDQLKLRGALS